MRKLFQLIAFLLSLLLLGGSVIAAPASKKKVPAKDAQAKEAAPVAAETVVKRKEIKYTGLDSKRDPFKAPDALLKLLSKPENLLADGKSSGPEKLPKIDLQGIIAGSRPQVIINNVVYKAGDFIEKFEIKQIQSEGIILFYKGRDYTIIMPKYKEPVKRRTR